MKTMREMNVLLMSAIRSVMTDDQLDAKLGSGQTTRQILAQCSLSHTQINPDADSVTAKESARTGRIKAYWHPHGYISPTKPNDEWHPLVLENWK